MNQKNKYGYVFGRIGAFRVFSVILVISPCCGEVHESGRWVVNDKIRCNTTLSTHYAAVSCHYPWDIKEKLLDFNVVILKCNSSEIEDAVLMCNWIKPERPTCKISEGYTYDFVVSTTLTLQVPRKSLENKKQYRCQVAPPKNESVPCGAGNATCIDEELKHYPSLKTTQTTAATLSEAMEMKASMDVDAKIGLAAGISVLALLIGIAVAVVYLKSFMISLNNKRRSGEPSDQPTNQVYSRLPREDQEAGHSHDDTQGQTSPDPASSACPKPISREPLTQDDKPTDIKENGVRV